MTMTIATTVVMTMTVTMTIAMSIVITITIAITITMIRATTTTILEVVDSKIDESREASERRVSYFCFFRGERDTLTFSSSEALNISAARLALSNNSSASFALVSADAFA